ncbi:MAG TPA: DUF1836 domain-containing protein [Candidatus Pullilachnospira gallistercoris]|uniref:DUF1836 domain-containing protein n=1 Tax=Candidatus Pullilachnospira gallistercoris TaxID=2840911 RepID=A0A9D1E9V3_9FIRM|nr:DUF1836 domain-containing protein [Candidatus Pullilachnospira gallistercoris]
MHSESRQLLNELLKTYSRLDYVKPEDIPDIDLYVDQVTTFIDSHLESVKRSPEDKLLTKTMINNYTKNHVLPSPDKKKYSRDHLLMLIYIYYFKSFLSIKDIQTLLKPITEKYFGKDTDTSFFDIYKELVEMGQAESRNLFKDILSKYSASQKTFADAPEEDREALQSFAFICLLSFDVYVKKLLIEKFIDLTV